MVEFLNGFIDIWDAISVSFNCSNDINVIKAANDQSKTNFSDEIPQRNKITTHTVDIDQSHAKAINVCSFDTRHISKQGSTLAMCPLARVHFLGRRASSGHNN